MKSTAVVLFALSCSPLPVLGAIKGQASDEKRERDLQISVAIDGRKYPPIVNKNALKISKPDLFVEVAVTENPSASPTNEESVAPTNEPSIVPTRRPTPPPTFRRTFQAGTFNTRDVVGLKLSVGLNARKVATTGDNLIMGFRAKRNFHFYPDGAEVFEWENGGWIYVSNSEDPEKGYAGVYAIFFDRYGRVVDYQLLMSDTQFNCSGGRTPWNTYISCEEHSFGSCWQVDPLSKRRPQRLYMDFSGGYLEAFAYDDRDKSKPRFFVTQDLSNGVVHRFTPGNPPDWEDPWKMLHEPGDNEYLMIFAEDVGEERRLQGGDENASEYYTGTYAWTKDLDEAKENSLLNYNYCEGIDRHENKLYFTCKTQYLLFVLDLDTDRFDAFSTFSGIMDGQPDQVKRLINEHSGNSMLYFTEERNLDEEIRTGIHARDSDGNYFSILESAGDDLETTGLAFSPDGTHMYFTFQQTGVMYDVWRLDRNPFQAAALKVNYHGNASTRRLHQREA